jgi:hypothetical protein
VSFAALRSIVARSITTTGASTSSSAVSIRVAVTTTTGSGSALVPAAIADADVNSASPVPDAASRMTAAEVEREKALRMTGSTRADASTAKAS